MPEPNPRNTRYPHILLANRLADCAEQYRDIANQLGNYAWRGLNVGQGTSALALVKEAETEMETIERYETTAASKELSRQQLSQLEEHRNRANEYRQLAISRFPSYQAWLVQNRHLYIGLAKTTVGHLQHLAGPDQTGADIAFYCDSLPSLLGRMATAAQDSLAVLVSKQSTGRQLLAEAGDRLQWSVRGFTSGSAIAAISATTLRAVARQVQDKVIDWAEPDQPTLTTPPHDYRLPHLPVGFVPGSSRYKGMFVYHSPYLVDTDKQRLSSQQP